VTTQIDLPAAPKKMPSKKSAPTIADVAHGRKHFNLADEPWIDVIYNGRIEKVGLRDLFLEAHQIQSLATVDVLARFALWRTFIAFTHLLSNSDPSLKGRLLDSVGFDPSAVNEVFAEHHERLWLIHPTFPFAQNLNPTTLAATTEVSVGTLGALLIDVPGGSSQAWFTRPGDAPIALAEAEAAHALLARWFYGPSGNSPKIANAELGALTRTEGGRALWGNRDLTHAVRTGDNLFQTLVGNLTAIDGASIALLGDDWIGPGGAALVAADGLLASTVTGSGALLVDDLSGRFSAVVTGSAPVRKDKLKVLLARDDPKNDMTGWSDPHTGVIRTTKISKSGVQTIEDKRIHIPPIAGFRFLHTYARNLVTPKATNRLRGILTVADLKFGRAAADATPHLEFAIIESGAGTMNVSFTQISHIELPASRFVTDPTLAESLYEILDFVYGEDASSARRSLWAAVTIATRTKDSVRDKFADNAERDLLNRIESATAEIVDRVTADPDPISDEEILAFRRRCALAALDAYETAIQPIYTGSYAASIADGRRHLLAKIPKEQTT
jgi:hypothetical protein